MFTAFLFMQHFHFKVTDSKYRFVTSIWEDLTAACHSAG